MTDLASVKDKFAAEIAGAGDLKTLDDIRVAALGKKGEVSMMMRGLGKMTPDEKKVMDPALNGLKNDITGLVDWEQHILANFCSFF